MGFRINIDGTQYNTMETTADSSFESNEILSRIERAIQSGVVESKSPEAEVLRLVHSLMEDFSSLPETDTNKMKERPETRRSTESIERYRDTHRSGHQAKYSHGMPPFDRKSPFG